MGVRAEFRAWILQLAGVKKLLADRLFPDVAPEDCGDPYGVYSRVGVAGWRSLEGVERGRSVGFLLSFAAKSSEVREQLVEAVRAEVEKPWNRMLGEQTFVNKMTVEDEHDYAVDLSDGSGREYATDMQIAIVHDGKAR